MRFFKLTPLVVRYQAGKLRIERPAPPPPPKVPTRAELMARREQLKDRLSALRVAKLKGDATAWGPGDYELEGQIAVVETKLELLAGSK